MGARAAMCVKRVAADAASCLRALGGTLATAPLAIAAEEDEDEDGAPPVARRTAVRWARQRTRSSSNFPSLLGPGITGCFLSATLGAAGSCAATACRKGISALPLPLSLSLLP